MITFDFEDNSKGEFFLASFYDGQKFKTFETKNYKDLDTCRRRILDFIFSSGEDIFIAHNLEYDLAHIFQGVYLTLIDWYYSDKLLFALAPNKKIKFIDSFNFSFSSLKDLPVKDKKKIIDIENIFDLYEKDPERVIDYNQRDCKVIFDYMSNFENSIRSLFDMKLKNTLAGTSQTIFLDRFLEHDISGKNINEEILKAYYGGRTECFYIGSVRTPVYEIDVNSMYPYVMQKNLFPVSDNYFSEEPQEDFYISKIKVKIRDCNFPILPYRKGKLLFPVGEFTTYASSMEIEKAKNENQIESIEYLETYNFPEVDYIFRDFVKYFYDKRKIAKEMKNDFDSNLYKLILNSTYGRFALHKELKILTAITPKNRGVIEPLNSIAGYMPYNINSTKGKNYAVALFVTSYARIELYDLINKVSSSGFSPLYCDTDSVYFTDFKKSRSLFDEINYILKKFPIDSALGNYSLLAYESGEFLNVKSYFLNSYTEAKKIKQKGVRKDKREEFMREGKVKYKKPVKLRSSLRTIQGLKVNEWIDFEYEKRSEYDKRKILKFKKDLFKTKPINIKEDNFQG